MRGQGFFSLFCFYLSLILIPTPTTYLYAQNLNSFGSQQEAAPDNPVISLEEANQQGAPQKDTVQPLGAGNFLSQSPLSASELPYLPEGWTRAVSNPDFAYQINESTNDGPHSSTLRFLNLVSNQEYWCELMGGKEKFNTIDVSGNGTYGTFDWEKGEGDIEPMVLYFKTTTFSDHGILGQRAKSNSNFLIFSETIPNPHAYPNCSVLDMRTGEVFNTPIAGSYGASYEVSKTDVSPNGRYFSWLRKDCVNDQCVESANVYKLGEPTDVVLSLSWIPVPGTAKIYYLEAGTLIYESDLLNGAVKQISEFDLEKWTAVTNYALLKEGYSFDPLTNYYLVSYRGPDYEYLHVYVFDTSLGKSKMELLKSIKMRTNAGGNTVSIVKNISNNANQLRFVSFTYFDLVPYNPQDPLLEHCCDGTTTMTRLVDVVNGRQISFEGRALTVVYKSNVAIYSVLNVRNGRVNTIKVDLKSMELLPSRSKNKPISNKTSRSSSNSSGKSARHR